MVTDTTLLRGVVRPFTGSLRREMVEALSTITASPTDQARYDELAEKNTEGSLTGDEREELESLVEAHSLISALKTEATAALASR
jgi:hypothetical protein